MNGVLVINKPQGFTSFDVVAVARRLSGQRKIGHTGTLDPNATGVLPLLLGNAAKAQDILPNHDKSYVAGFRLGITTDTLDIWGEVKATRESRAKREEAERIIPDFTGEIEQIPPMFSAVYHNGQRLYDLARKGIEVERQPRRVTVYELALTSFDEENQSGTLAVSCSKGTYIRTLIDDLGARLGTGAVMTSLERTAACGYTLADCVTLDEARELADSSELERRLRPTESLFEVYPELAVSDAQARRFSNGGALDISRTRLAGNARQGGLFRVKTRRGEFLGLGEVDGESLKIYKLFK